MKCPLLAPIGWCAGGILCGWYLAVPLPLLWAVVVVILVTAWSQRNRIWWIPALCLLFGWINTAVRTQVISASDLRLRIGDTPLLCQIHGRIDNRPIISRPVEERSSPRWRTVVNVQSLTANNQHLPAKGMVLVFSEGDLHQRLSKGMEVSVSGLVERASTQKAPGIFDYREKLRREGIHYQLDTVRDSDWTIAPDQAHSWPDRFQAWAKQRFASGLREEDRSLRLLWAMVLGWRTALTDEVAEPFMQSGTMHVFAISGLHIAMIGGALVMFFRLFQIPRHVCGMLTVPLLWFYCEATGMQASATRATVMMTIVVSGWALKRPLNLLNSICAAAFIILAWEPRQLLQASFQLSFSVVTTIALLLPRFDPLKERLFRTDPLLPDDLTPWWKKKVVKAGRWCFAAFAVSIAAWLGSAPLIAYYFNLVTPGCLIANPFVVICAMFGICSAVGGILTFWCPWLPECFNNSAWFWVTCQTSISQWTAHLPGSWWRITTPNQPEIGCYYLTLVGVICGWFRYRWFTFAITATAVALVYWRIDDSRCTEITVFGHNTNAVLIDMPGVQNDLLIDCGRKEGFRSCLDPYLDRNGIEHIPTLLLSHGDINHVEAFRESVERLRPLTIYASAIRQRSPSYRSALESVQDERAKSVVAGDQIGVWSVLHPPAALKPVRADEAAIVLRTEWRGTGILFLSDLNEAGQRRLLNSSRDLSAEILIAGSPPGGLLSELLVAVDPELIVLQGNRTPVIERISYSETHRYEQHAGRVVNLSMGSSARIRLGKEWQVVP